MDIWIDRLADVDDEYLVGLSNKGIVKRAYKDKEETCVEVDTPGEEAGVRVGDETVTIRFPLGESKCSCPSRSICRHVVLAILALREKCLQKGAGAGEEPEEGKQRPTGEPEEDSGSQGAESEEPGEPEEDSGSRDGALREVSGQGAGSQGRAESEEPGQGAGSPGGAEGEEPGESAGSRDGALREASGQDTGREGAKGEERADRDAGPKRQTAVWKEINEYPFEKLKKTMGSRQFQAFVNQVLSGIRPGIRSSTVVTVQLPEAGFVVKLLAPLEYSSCTCHKKELCVHKAAAILWCQLEAGILTRETLSGEITVTQEFRMDSIREAAAQMKAFLEELFDTGLSRTSPDVLDYLERLAIISHNEGLARFEGYFRALSDSYDRYLARKAAFRTEDLMAQMARLYRRADMLLKARDSAGTAKLAGEFKADYLPVGNLDLIGISMEHFQSQNGYEGETIYFLEENTKKWYTYTNARPVFYDAPKRRGYAEKSGAPWGLNISFENLLKVRIHLTGAKCDDRNRLSSSQDTKGEITGEKGLSLADVETWYYRDFGDLFTEQIGKLQREWLGEQKESAAELVFVRPAACGEAVFSQTGQQLTLPLYDDNNREIVVEVTYSKQEAGTIRYLERIRKKKIPCFLGKIYLKEGRVRMYPVDLPDIAEQEDADDIAEETESPQDADNLDRDYLQSGMEGMEISAGHKSKYQVMEDLAGEILSQMEDLYQSGFGTVHDSTWKDIQKTAGLTAQYGMAYLSELLSSLAGEIAAGRHQMRKRTAAMTEIYVKIMEYLYLLGQKAAYDKGAHFYSRGNEADSHAYRG